MVNQIRGPEETTAGAESPAHETINPPEEMAEGSTQYNRRSTLVEKADADSDDDSDEQLLSKEEFDMMVSARPEEFLKEIRQLIRQQRGLNLAHAQDLSARSDNEEQITQLKEKIQRREQTILTMLEGTQNLEAGRARLGTPFADKAKLAKIADPPFFFNKPAEDKLGFDEWLGQVKSKLKNDGELYPTEARKIAYVAGLLRGTAYSMISPRLDDAKPDAYRTITDFYEHMVSIWSNPNKVKDARAAFRALSMGKTRTFQEFYAEFSRLVAEGQITDQNDLKDELYTKLWWKLQEGVISWYTNDQYGLHAFAQKCATTDRLIRDRLNQIPPKVQREKTVAPNPGTPFRETRQIPTPKEVSEPAKAVAATSRPALLCYNCNKAGHIARLCPEPKTERHKRYLAFVSNERKLAQEERKAELEDSGKEDS